MSSSYFIRRIFISFMAGIFFGSFFSWQSFFVIFFCYFLFLFFFRIFFQKFFLIFLFVGSAFFFGTFRFLLVIPVFEIQDIASYTDTIPLTFEAIVQSDPDIRTDSISFVVEARKLFLEQKEILVQGKVLLTLQRYPEYHYGDFLQIRGNIQKPLQFGKFSYADALAKDDIFAVMYNPVVNFLHSGAQNDFLQLFYQFKSFIIYRLESLFPEPIEAIVSGILLGLRRGIPMDILEDFNKTGLTHILAISGYNITLLITILGFILKSQGRKIRFYITVSVILFFALLTGFSASVIRASIMGIVVIFAAFSGRKTSGIQALLFTGCVMAFINPRILRWDISFQLSFFATLGLLLFMPRWDNFLKKFPAPVAEGFAVTLAAQILTLPLILFYFGRVSLIAPFANILFLPFIPLLMLCSFFTLLSSLLFLPWTFFGVGITWFIGEVLQKGVKLLASLPFSSVEISYFSWWMLFLYYGIVAFFIFHKSK